MLRLNNRSNPFLLKWVTPSPTASPAFAPSYFYKHNGSLFKASNNKQNFGVECVKITHNLSPKYKKMYKIVIVRALKNNCKLFDIFQHDRDN